MAGPCGWPNKRVAQVAQSWALGGWLDVRARRVFALAERPAKLGLGRRAGDPGAGSACGCHVRAGEWPGMGLLGQRAGRLAGSVGSVNPMVCV